MSMCAMLMASSMVENEFSPWRIALLSTKGSMPLSRSFSCRGITKLTLVSGPRWLMKTWYVVKDCCLLEELAMYSGRASLCQKIRSSRNRQSVLEIERIQRGRQIIWLWKTFSELGYFSSLQSKVTGNQNKPVLWYLVQSKFECVSTFFNICMRTYSLRTESFQKGSMGEGTPGTRIQDNQKSY